MKSPELYHRSLPQNEMDQFGSVNEEDCGTVERRREQRIKRGECPTCQRKTHKISRFRGKREPLTVEGEVVNGICLNCNPLTKSSSSRPPPAAGSVPDAFECDDDVTVASEITLDTCIIEQQASKRSSRRETFESVSEESPMTEFKSRDGDQIPTNIIGSQRGRRVMSRLVEEEDDDEEEDEKWKKQQRRQKFHPMSTEMYLFNSERSLGIESTGTGTTDGSENSSEHFRPPKLHPLSKYIYNTSERSLSVSINQSDQSLSTESQNVSSNGSGKDGKLMASPMMKREQSTNSLLSSDSGYSSDGERIKNLLQGSPTMKAKVCENLALPVAHNEADKDDSARQRNNDSFQPAAVKPAANRFSLQQVEKNRFSLTLNDIPRSKLRASDPTDYNYEMEFQHSRKWDSVDILRDAAKEANGETFNMDDFIKEMEAEKKQQANTQSDSDDILPPETTSPADKVEAMFSSLSMPPTSADVASMTKAINKRKGRDLSTSMTQLASIEDIPVIIQCVKTRPTAVCTEKAFQTLFLLSTNPYQEGRLAREKILSSDGMETLISSVWEHIDNDQVLRALFHALWALSVFDLSDDSSNAVTLNKITNCSVIEGMLAAMQMHATDLTILEAGFDIVGRLAGLLPADASCFESAIDVISGLMRNMDIKSRSYSSGVFALNGLCQSSVTRKREFANNNNCYEAIRRVLGTKSVSLRRREIACSVFWVVTSDRASVSALKIELAQDIIDALQGFSSSETQECSGFFEAACGTLANLALDTDNHAQLVKIGVIQVLCEAVDMHSSSEDVMLVCCTAFANLTASNVGFGTSNTETQGVINSLFSCIKAKIECPEVIREAFRALNNLTDTSSEVKQIISCDLDTIISTCNRYKKDKYMQSTTCSMLGRLSCDITCAKVMISLPEIYDVLAIIIQANPSMKMIDAQACLILRNISSQENVARSISFVPFVMVAMTTHIDSEEMLENACFFLSNVGSKEPDGFSQLCTEDGVRCIINAMQTYPTSTSLQEACCGALHVTIRDSDEHKTFCISAGAVDAIICVILVHPNETSVIENALRVLVTLSSQGKCVKAISDAGGISTVVEIMRSNSVSPSIIDYGSRFITSMVDADPEYANEAVPGITSILTCMKQQTQNTPLIEALCKSLHSLVLASENCADRVISADGVTAVEAILHENENNTVIVQQCNSLLHVLRNT